jgi:hypothetical protein
MIYIFGALIVVAVLAFYVGWHTGHDAGYIAGFLSNHELSRLTGIYCRGRIQTQDEPIDWDKWEEKDHVR